MNIFMEDVLNQAKYIEKAIESYDTDATMKLLDEIACQSYSKVIFTGMGSSNYACQGASVYLNGKGIDCCVVSAGQLYYYGLNCIDEKALVVLVSQSGESPETVDLIHKLKDRVNTIGITNAPDSTMGRNIRRCLYLNVPNEVSVSSRTYTTTVIMSYLVATSLVNYKKDCIIRAKKTVENLKKFIDDYKDKTDELAAFFKDVSFISCMGRGPSYGSALAGGLFLKEASKFPCEGTDAAEFRHGPIEVVDEHFGAVVFAPEGKTQDLTLKMAHDIAVKGGKVLLVTNQTLLSLPENIYVMRYESVNDFCAPILDIAAIQLLCSALAKKTGIVPGEFRWASKITREE